MKITSYMSRKIYRLIIFPRAFTIKDCIQSIDDSIKLISKPFFISIYASNYTTEITFSHYVNQRWFGNCLEIACPALFFTAWLIINGMDSLSSQRWLEIACPVLFFVYILFTIFESSLILSVQENSCICQDIKDILADGLA